MCFFCPYSKIFSNQWGLGRFYAILVTINWSSSYPKLIIRDPDPANNFGSERIRIHNTDPNAGHKSLGTGMSYRMS